MAYNYSETGVLTAAADGLLIGRSGTLVPNPDYRLLTVKGAGQQYTNFVYSSGGTGVVSSGAVLNAVINSGAFVRLSAYGIAENTTILSGGTLQFANNAEAKNLTVAAGGSLTGVGAVPGVIKLGGTENHIAAGTILGALGAHTDENGILSGWTGSNSATFCSGIVVSGAVCDSGGFLIVSSGASMLGASILSGGTMRVSSAGYAENTVVSSGGSLLLTAGNEIVNITLEEGAFATGNIRLGGTSNRIARGTYQNALNAYTDENGVLWGWDATAATTFWKNIVVSDALIRTYTYVSSASICGATVTGGGIGMRDGAYVCNAQVQEDGHIYVMSSAANNILGGSETTFAAGAVVYCNGGVNNSPKTDENLYAESGVLHNLKLVNSGVWIQKLFLRDGIAADTPVISNAGSLTLESGASANDAQIYGGGWLVVSDGGRADRTSLNAGTARLILKAGGEALDTILSGGTMRISANTVGRGTVISAGSMAVVADGNAYDTTVSGGSAIIEDNASASGGEVLAGGTLDIKSGGVVSNFAVSSGAVANISGKLITNREVWGAEIFGGNASLTLSSGAVANKTRMFTNDGWLVVSKGAAASGTIMNAATARLITKDGGEAIDTLLSGGTMRISSNCAGRNTTMYGGLHAVVKGGVAYDTTVSGGSFTILDGGKASGVTATDGKTVVSNGGALIGGAFSDQAQLRLWNGASLGGATLGIAAGTVYFDDAATGVYAESGTLKNLVLDGYELALTDGLAACNVTVKAGAKLHLDASVKITGAKTSVAAGTLYYGTTIVADAAIDDGVFTGLGADGASYRFSVGDGIVVKDAYVGDNDRLYGYGNAVLSGLRITGTAANAAVVLYGEAEAYDATLTGGGKTTLLAVGENAAAYGTVVNSGGTLRFNAGTGAMYGTVVNSGGTLDFNNLTGGSIEDTTLMAGAKVIKLVAGANTGSKLTVDFSTGNSISVNDLSAFGSDTAVYVRGVTAADTYTLGQAGALAKVTRSQGLYNEELTSGGASYTNGIAGLTFSFDGTTLTATDAGIGTVAAAAKLAAGATAINGEDLAAKWDASTAYSANVFLADGMTTGNAWLKLDGFANTAANLYGTGKDQDFAGTVNIGASKGTIKNLAAGAALGGKVGGVKLTVEDGMRVTGAVYAGGMGDVTGATETLVEGGAFSGNVFAGALCNYVANTTATAAGDIALTVNGGTFANNIYAGAAVKAGAATGVVHTVQNIAVELNDGTASRPSFCVYGGGYATGTTESKVYAAGDVDITVTGGSWGKYQSGRGIFGGVYTDKVAASVEDVNINVSGGTLGNIYGGGWAQNGGTSTAGNVSITVSGDAEVNNVYGGGCYSTTGGATGVGNVEIVVAGGSIANNIFAGGFGENSTVAGDVSVKFRGSNAYSCNVYGYITPENAASAQDKLLSFDGFTGAVAGAIGGFDSIEFANDTATTLSGAIDNGAWSFDYTGRTLDTAAVALTGGTFTGDALTLKLDASDAPANWNIASGLADTAIGFDYEVYVGGALQTFDDGKIASGDYAGWGFDLNEGVLKFKNLA